jgi:hypothetical protein
MNAEFSFCESVHAGSNSHWHIRKLTEVGKKPGGGIDTASLCGHVRPSWGWDVEVTFNPSRVSDICKKCLHIYLQKEPSKEHGV